LVPEIDRLWTRTYVSQLAPGAVAAMMHSPSLQGEFVYLLDGACIARLGK
jgi:uncharacterized cupin superfamily protein